MRIYIGIIVKRLPTTPLACTNRGTLSAEQVVVTNNPRFLFDNPASTGDDTHALCTRYTLKTEVSFLHLNYLLNSTPHQNVRNLRFRPQILDPIYGLQPRKVGPEFGNI